MIPAYYLQRAVARIESIGVNVTDTNVQYIFRSHPYINTSYNGNLIVQLNQATPAGTSGTLPVVFNSGNGTANMAVTKRGGKPLLAKDLDGVGVFEFYYNSETGVLQFIA